MASSSTTTILFSSLHITETAQIGGTYVPPMATRVTTGLSRPTTTTTTTSRNPNPTTPAFRSDWQWINSYLTIHKISTPSYRYSYILWLVILLFVIIFAILHYTGSRGGSIGASWSKWSLRRRTWRKKSTLAAINKAGQPHRQPWSLPSNAQILCLVVLFIIPALLCVVGPDYIAPGTRVWDLTHNLTRRAFDEHIELFKRQSVASTPTTRAPDFTIPKQWWTIGGRTGIIAFALMPLVVLFALKAPPFALFALPFTTQIHFDKLALLHRWAGRLIWLVTTIHVATWTVQLCRDHRHGRGGYAIEYVWVYKPFLHGMAGYVALTLLTILSIGPIRKKYYEFFYIGHIILVPVTLIESALHFPPIWWWCWAPLTLWLAERAWRLFKFLVLNGFIWNASAVQKGPAFVYPDDDEKHLSYSANQDYQASSNNSNGRQADSKGESWEMGIRKPQSSDSQSPFAKQIEQEPSYEYSPMGQPGGGDTDGGTRHQRALSGDSNDSFTDSITDYYNGSGANTATHVLVRKTGDYSSVHRKRMSGLDEYGDVYADPQQKPQRQQPGWVDYETQFREQLSSISTPKISPGQQSGYPFPSSSDQQASSSHRAERSNASHTSPTKNIKAPRPVSVANIQSIYPPSFHTGPGSIRVKSHLAPLGYARVQKLPGRTLRLSLATPRRFTWAPGQHVMLNMPEISKYTSHPFTIASVSDNAVAGPEGREIVLIIRAKNGFTKQLWDAVQKWVVEARVASITNYGVSVDEKAKGRKSPGLPNSPAADQPAKPGAIMRACVDGPFGSVVRARWGQHSSVLIICGGSGVSFGLSILEYICLCMTGRDGHSLGGKGGGMGKDSFLTRRVRFVWLIREYSHIQWCATNIRRCLDMIQNPNALQVDIFVTNFAYKSVPISQDLNSMYMGGAGIDVLSLPAAVLEDDSRIDGGLAPPVPHFARQARPRSYSNSSIDSNGSSSSMVDLAYARGGNGKGNGRGMNFNPNDMDTDEHVLDLTNFDGEDDTRLPGEAQLSLKVKKEGRLRRAKTRKVASAANAKADLELKVHPIDENAPYQQPTARIVPQTPTRSAARRQSWIPDAPLPAPIPRSAERGFALYDPPISGQTPSGQLSVQDPRRWGESNTPTNGGSPSPLMDHPDHYSPASHIPPPRLSDVRGPPSNPYRFSVAASIQSGFMDRGVSPSPNDSSDTKTLAGSESIRGLMYQHKNQQHSTAILGGDGGSSEDAFAFDMDEDEIEDLNVVSEMARPGKPRLDRILADEVERARGSVAVACCGPTSLNALVRKLVAAQIDPERIKRGDMRGHITLVSEDFEW